MINKDFEVDCWTYRKAVSYDTFISFVSEIYSLLGEDITSDKDILKLLKFYFQWEDNQESGFDLQITAYVRIFYENKKLEISIRKPYSFICIRFDGVHMSLQTNNSPYYGL